VEREGSLWRGKGAGDKVAPMSPKVWRSTKLIKFHNFLLALGMNGERAGEDEGEGKGESTKWGGREGGTEGGREGGGKRGREGGRKGGWVGGWVGGREGGREECRKGGGEGGRESGNDPLRSLWQRTLRKSELKLQSGSTLSAYHKPASASPLQHQPVASLHSKAFRCALCARRGGDAVHVCRAEE
jgi:hypothetical protein